MSFPAIDPISARAKDPLDAHSREVFLGNTEVVHTLVCAMDGELTSAAAVARIRATIELCYSEPTYRAQHYALQLVAEELDPTVKLAETR